ncbi:hypothetical protein JW805_20755 [Roseomonas aeriglobus]|nr:hypothetical protein [Roseomonas aeriglobus]
MLSHENNPASPSPAGFNIGFDLRDQQPFERHRYRWYGRADWLPPAIEKPVVRSEDEVLADICPLLDQLPSSWRCRA